MSNTQQRQADLSRAQGSKDIHATIALDAELSRQHHNGFTDDYLSLVLVVEPAPAADVVPTALPLQWNLSQPLQPINSAR